MRSDWAQHDTLGSAATRSRNDSDPSQTGLRETASGPVVPPQASLQLPATVGPYRLRQKLGQGGMGEVHEAFHETLERHVAIKFLRAQVQDSHAGRRLLTEARATNRIRHPGLIEVSDSGVLPDGTAYIVMELLRGETLAVRAQRLGGKLPLALTLHLGWQIASTLAAAHQKGIIHRDLKPENVMLVPDHLAPLGERAKLLDFGLAKLLVDAAQSPRMTHSQQLLGTPLYMSPEQCRGAGAVDEKTDVYSLGVLLYALLAGRTPFTGDGVGDLIHQHIGMAPPPLAGFDPALPGAVVDFVHRLLSKSPASRPTMAAVVEDLARLYAELAPGSAPGVVAKAALPPAEIAAPPPELGHRSAPSAEKKESAPDTPDERPTVSEPPSDVAAAHPSKTDSAAAPLPAAPATVGSHPSLEGAAAGVLASPTGGRRLLWLGLPLLLIAGLMTARWFRPAPKPGGSLTVERVAAPTGPAASPSAPNVAATLAPGPMPTSGGGSAASAAGLAAPTPSAPTSAPTPTPEPASQMREGATTPPVAAPARSSVRRSPVRGTRPPRRSVFRVIDD